MFRKSFMFGGGCASGLLLLTAAGVASAAPSETVLYSFCANHNCTDGSDPAAAPIIGKDGMLYGTTHYGGANGGGTVFAVDPQKNNAETVLWSFPGRTDDGANPSTSLVEDKKQNLFGTTPYGGAHDGAGTVFEISKADVETVIYNFCSLQNCADGEEPMANLVLDSKGNMYGTTIYGGEWGYGTVFKVTPKGAESVLYSFCPKTDCYDGAHPASGLVADKNGNLYGTTPNGGANGDGVIFEIASNGSESTLYSFCSQQNCADGDTPEAGLTMDASGNLYGTTYYGGADGDGTLFEYSAAGKESILYSFCSDFECPDGASPDAGLAIDKTGNLYGTTYFGGEHGDGAAFEYTPKSKKESVLYSFCSVNNCADGNNPIAGLAVNKSGNVFGTTPGGGLYEDGTLFEIKK
jgi:uncharacterized repeat protein (TIGR03803 family)